jgi:hypothetical protein
MSAGVLLEAVPAEEVRQAEPKVMSEAAARKLTERIRRSIDGLHAMMLQAYESQAHIALGYERWEDYVKGEFSMTRSESYRLINQGRVIKAISTAGGMSHARDIAGSISIRAAEVLKHDLTLAATEVVAAIEAGMEPQEAVREAVSRRTQSAIGPAPALAALPAPTTVRRGALFDDQELLDAAADLRERLRDCFSTIKAHVGRAPRREGVDQDTLREELRQWLIALSLIVSQDHLEGLYMLRAEIYDWLKQLGDERAAIAQLAGVTPAAVDYSVGQLHAVVDGGGRKKRA